MDGNFQLKRNATEDSLEVLEEVYTPSNAENALCGDNNEVEHFEQNATQEKKNVSKIFDTTNLVAKSNIHYLLQCLEAALFKEPDNDSNFKAANNRKGKKNTRYDETSVFSMSCARYGIPERLYNIYGAGDGYDINSL